MSNKNYYVPGVHRYVFTDVDGILGERDEYRKYKEEFDKAMECNNMGRPMYIDIEVNNYCNMKCKMCHHSIIESTNGKDNISLEMLDKMLLEARKMKVPSFFLGGGTECLINPNIVDIIKHIRLLGQGIDDVLITNGYQLTDEIIDLLLELKWEKLFVSLDAATPETYKKIRGRELDVVENNLNRIIEKKKELGVKLPIIRVSFCTQEENKHERKLFFDKWKDKVDIIDYQDLEVYKDGKIIKGLPDTNLKCNSAFSKMMLYCDGRLTPCCSGVWSEYLCVGNIKDMTLEEAWNCDEVNRIRNEMIEGRLNDVCKTCLYSTEVYSY